MQLLDIKVILNIFVKEGCSQIFKRFKATHYISEFDSMEQVTSSTHQRQGRNTCIIYFYARMTGHMEVTKILWMNSLWSIHQKITGIRSDKPVLPMVFLFLLNIKLNI